MGRLRNGVGIGISNIPTLSSRRAFSPLSLFADGSQGVWYDDSLTSSMFQDSAGTVAAVLESPVGKQLDLSGNNNHRTQATSANRPTLSARYNLLTKTEQFDNAVWTKPNLTITANATTDPLGGNTADKLAENSTVNLEHYLLQTQTVVAAQHTFSVYLKAAERTWAILTQTTGSFNSTWFNLAADGSGGVGTVGTGCTATSTYVGNGWYQCSVTRTTTAAAWQFVIEPTLGNNVSPVYVGTVGYGIYAWGADLRPADQATGLIPTYQRVDTSSVYDTVGFPQYIKYDGLNSSLSTASINFTATAQMSVFSGVRKLSGTISIIAELSTIIDTNNGSFALANAVFNASDYFYGSKGSVIYSKQTKTGYTAPITNVVTGLSDIAAPSVNIRVNTVAAVAVTTSQGTGTYGNYAIYFGSRAGTTFFFNGLEFQTIIVGKTLTAAQITATETYINSKTLAY
jgi:hypothetical protein